MAGYGGLLAQAAGAANPAAHGVGQGDPPQFQDQPPLPTNIGAVPTGSPGTAPKQAADEAVLSLRAMAGFFPSIGPDIEQMITKIKGAQSAKSAGPPRAPLGSAQPPGAATAEVPPTDLSGGPGPM